MSTLDEEDRREYALYPCKTSQSFCVVHFPDLDDRARPMEDADHGKALHAREHARRSHGDFRRDEGQLVADAHAELGRRLVADSDAKAAGRQVVQFALLHEVIDDRDIAFLRRVDGIEQDFLHLAVVGQQALTVG